MPAKKVSDIKDNNIDKLLKKVGDLGRIVDELQINVAAIASAVMNLEETMKKETSIILRVKDRLGL